MSEENNKKEKISVKIDTERTELLARENERLKMEQEKQKNEPDLSDLKLQAIQKFGRPDLFLQADTKEKLNAILTSFINELAEKSQRNPNPSGTAPLNDAQLGRGKEDLYTRKFLDSQSMVSELRRLSHEGTPEEKEEANRYITALFRQYALDKRANPTRPEPSQNPNSPESLSELDLVQKDSFLTPRNKEDGDLQKLQKAWRLERKRKMENQI